ncbi:hypothetical protein L5C03_25265 [Pseudomonas aeruginosa]|nr:hypothetical protein [Pseudomonas aeruginosa]MDG4298029.1 hypothetical protein [Pseudomonas aeruginosa]
MWHVRVGSLAPLKCFARNLRKYAGVGALPMSDSVLDGLNIRTKIIQRMAYGFQARRTFLEN